ncbi:L-2-amino-thiazoline-4-carboxylic acid hydrolase [Desulfitobacterium sp. Sab5]|uniref:L-2-amino-thiazoline-4-carboxylic acid hydrolase n=1 Tax=Desulfitobacterium nosdiversum TaxID=3375356 RepID=UPI003CE6A1C8
MRYKRAFIAITSLIVLASVTILAILNIYGKSTNKNSGCFGGGCSGCNGCSNKGRVNITYYKSKESQLLDTLNNYQKIFKNELRKSNSEEEIFSIAKETKEEFVRLIPQIPYIGGDANSMTEDIERAAMVLALYKVESRHGKSADEVGEIVVNAIKDEMSKYPKWLMRFNGRKFFTNTYIEKVRKEAEVSQIRQYSGAWVTDFIKGNGKDFDYGFNHQECGIVKFFHEQNAEELTPYLCELDFIYSDAMDEGLVRTSTLAEGGEYCDFRYKRVENRKSD